MARKTAIIITCDNCKFLAEVDDLGEMPRDWYHVALPNHLGKLHPTQNGFDLCSLDCMSQWALNRKEAWKEHKASPVVNEPAPKVIDVQPTKSVYRKHKCDFCDKKIANSGMRLHVRFNHPEIWEDWANEKGLDLNKSFGKAGTKNA